MISNDYKKVLFVAFPVIIEMLSSLVLGLVDTGFVGHLGKESLTAVGLSIRVLMVTVTLFTVLASGASILIAQSYGAGDIRKAQRYAETFMAGDFILGVFFAFIWIFFARNILSLMGADDEVVAIGVDYVRALGLVGFFGTFIFVPNTVLKAVGKTYLTLLIATVVNLTNLLFDYLLIFGKYGFPEMGVTGAGLATAIGYLAGGAVAMFILYHFSVPVKITPEGVLHPDLHRLKKMIYIGFPASIEFLAYHLGQMFVIRLTAVLGTASVAIFQLVTRLMGISYLTVFGVATAALALVGQSFGARDTKTANQMGKVSNRISILLASGIGLLFLFFPGELISILTNEKDLIGPGIPVMRIGALMLIPQAVNITLSGALKGKGETKWLMYTMAGGAVFLVLTVYIGLTFFGAGLITIFILKGLDELLRAGLNWMRFFSKKHTSPFLYLK